jgi:hypothetical protein
VDDPASKEPLRAGGSRIRGGSTRESNQPTNPPLPRARPLFSLYSPPPSHNVTLSSLPLGRASPSRARVRSSPPRAEDVAGAGSDTANRRTATDNDAVKCVRPSHRGRVRHGGPRASSDQLSGYPRERASELAWMRACVRASGGEAKVIPHPSRGTRPLADKGYAREYRPHPRAPFTHPRSSSRVADSDRHRPIGVHPNPSPASGQSRQSLSEGSGQSERVKGAGRATRRGC